MVLVNDMDVKRHFRYTQKDLDKAISVLKDEQNKEQYEYTANFSIIQEGGARQDCFNRPCHADISRPLLNNRTLVATECGWGRKNTQHPREMYQPFFDWLTKDSVYSQFIIWSDLDHGFVVTADMYAPMMQNIMILTRHFYERDKCSFDAFNTMVEEGINGNIAYVIAFNSTVRMSPGNAKFMSYYAHSVSPVYSLAAMKCFINGDVLSVDIDDVNYHYRLSSHYRGGKEMFWPINPGPSSIESARLLTDCMADEQFRRKLSDSRKGETVSAYSPPNPFAPRTSFTIDLLPTEITNDEAVKVLAPFVNDYFKAKGIIPSG